MAERGGDIWWGTSSDYFVYSGVCLPSSEALIKSLRAAAQSSILPPMRCNVKLGMNKESQRHVGEMSFTRNLGSSPKLYSVLSPEQEFGSYWHLFTRR